MKCKICGKLKEEHSINGYCLNKRNWKLTNKLSFTIEDFDNAKYLDSFNKKGEKLK